MKISLEDDKKINHDVITKNEGLSFLTEDEQLVLFAKLIIDIYLDNEHENEKGQ